MSFQVDHVAQRDERVILTLVSPPSSSFPSPQPMLYHLGRVPWIGSPGIGIQVMHLPWVQCRTRLGQRVMARPYKEQRSMEAQDPSRLFRMRTHHYRSVVVRDASHASIDST